MNNDDVQGTLFHKITEPDTTGLSHEEAFEKFHRENPHVYQLLRKEALRIKRRTSLKKVGIKLLFERLRWLYAFKTQEDNFKLNNNHHAFYSRELMKREPELSDFFRTRVQRSKHKIVGPIGDLE